MEGLIGGKYNKFLVAVVSVWIGWLISAFVPDGIITRHEWVGLAELTAGALGVFWTPNIDGNIYVPVEIKPKPFDDVGAPVDPSVDELIEPALVARDDEV